MNTLNASLSNLARGAVGELFEEELLKVAENILDINTAATATREITIKMTLKPKDDRLEVATSVKATSKLAPIKNVDTTLYMGRRGGRIQVEEQDRRQGDLFKTDQKPAEDEANAPAAAKDDERKVH